MTEVRDLQSIALTVPCDYCKAEPDEWCITMPKRQLAPYLHETRMWPLREAYAAGYIEASEGL